MEQRVNKFPDAVKLAQECIQSLRDDMKPMMDAMLGYYEQQMLNDPESFLAVANTHEGFKTVCLTISGALEKGEKLPPSVNEWLADYLRGGLEEPKRKAGRPTQALIPLWIVSAVNSCVTSEMKATRNDVSEPMSACDAVAEALENLGLEPTTYEGVKRVWLQSKNKYSPR